MVQSKKKRLASLPSECQPSQLDSLSRFSNGAHARGHTQCGGDGRENADDHLNDEFPSLFLHSRFVFLNVLVDWLGEWAGPMSALSSALPNG